MYICMYICYYVGVNLHLEWYNEFIGRNVYENVSVKCVCG